MLIALLFSCSEESNQIKISGKITSKNLEANNIVLTYDDLNPDSESSIDSVFVDKKGNYEIFLQSPNVISINVLNGEKTIENVATLALINSDNVRLNLEIEGSSIVSKEFLGSNVENMTYADTALHRLFLNEREIMNKYIKLDKKQRASLMPNARDILIGFHKSSLDNFRTEKSSFKKQIECLKNIIYTYDIGTMDYYDDIKTDLPYRLEPKEIFNCIPSASPLWQVNYQLPLMVISNYNFPFTIQGYTKNLKNNIDYLRKIITEHPNDDVSGYTVVFSLSTLTLSNEPGLIKEFSDCFEMRDGYKIGISKIYDINFAPNRKIKMGNQLPAFSFPSVSDSSVVFTNEFFKGKIYLLDFWATWCKPCMKEMPSHHKAYEKYKHGYNFDILSVSLDNLPELVEGFRENRWPMPWNHAILTKGKYSPRAKNFEVDFIPKMILVDGNTNTILAETFFIKEGKLEEVLEDYIK